MIKNLTEKELGHSFFYSMKIGDYAHALTLLEIGAPTNTSYFIEQTEIIYTISKFFNDADLVVSRTTEIIKKYGTSHSKSQLLIRILDACLENKPELRCRCNAKSPHYCALSQAFKFVRFDSQQDLLAEDNLIILKLLFNGATIRNLENSKLYKWVGINTLNSYINTNKGEVINLLKTNRHAKCCSRKENRNFKCSPSKTLNPCEV